MAWDSRKDYTGKTTFIPKGWSPTAKSVSELPMPLRHYIHELETSFGSMAFIIRDRARLIEENYALHAMVKELKERLGESQPHVS